MPSNTSDAVALSLEDSFAVIAPKIPTALISAEALVSIGRFARRFPGRSTSFFGFESQLGSARASADFLVCFAPEPESGRELLPHLVNALPPALAAHSAWKQVQAFAEEWSNASSVLYNRVENVWLEFDLADGASAEPLPSIFFGCLDQVRSTADDAEIRWLTERALPIVQGGAFSAKTGGEVEKAIRALPPGAFVFQIGAMLSRSTPAVRLCVRGLTGWQIPEYLQKIGWPGSPEELAVPFSEIAPLADRIDLDLDIGDNGVQPKIGLEWYLNNHLRVDPRWDTFLQWLVSHGLSTPEKSRALYDYPGAQHERSKSVTWPSYLRDLSAAAGPKVVSTIIRAVHHIKVVYHPNTGMEAKAYLAVSHSLLDTTPFILGQHPIQSVQLAPVPEFSATAPSAHAKA